MKTVYRTALLSLGVAVVAIPVAQAETNLVLNHYMSAKHPMIRNIVNPWAADVLRVTEGRVKMEVPVAPITNPRKQWDSIIQGAAGLSIHSDSFARKRLRLMDVGRLPFGGTTAKKTSIGLWRTYEKYISKAKKDPYTGVKFISIWTPAGNQVFTRERPIRALKDFKGLKLRTNAGLGARGVTTLGSTVVTSSGTEIFNLVSKGVVDGLVMPPDAIIRFKVDKYMKYYTDIPGSLYANSWSFIMNKKQWDGISKKDQAAIMTVSGEKMGAKAAFFDDIGTKAIKDFAAKGIQRVEASPAFVADMREKLKNMDSDWIADANKAGVDGKAALAYFRNVIKEIN